jgi:hypothetical protein
LPVVCVRARVMCMYTCVHMSCIWCVQWLLYENIFQLLDRPFLACCMRACTCHVYVYVFYSCVHMTCICMCVQRLFYKLQNIFQLLDLPFLASRMCACTCHVYVHVCNDWSVCTKNYSSSPVNPFCTFYLCVYVCVCVRFISWCISTCV